jgi:cystathionine beta-lyase/cystathionine gamma-synthase
MAQIQSPPEAHDVGITDSTIRMYIGFENIEAIMADLEQAFQKI